MLTAFFISLLSLAPCLISARSGVCIFFFVARSLRLPWMAWRRGVCKRAALFPTISLSFSSLSSSSISLSSASLSSASLSSASLSSTGRFLAAGVAAKIVSSLLNTFELPPIAAKTSTSSVWSSSSSDSEALMSSSSSSSTAHASIITPSTRSNTALSRLALRAFCWRFGVASFAIVSLI